MVQLKLTPEERERAIRFWWGNMLQGGLDHDIYDSVGRLYRAFRKVLERLSDEQFHNFYLLSPQLICLRSRGKVFQVLPGSPVIYLAPSVLRLTDRNLATVIADEVGHLVLSHHNPNAEGFDPRHHDQTDADKAVNALVERWGFKRPHAIHEH